MLTTMGQGVVLNALLNDGFVPSYYHFDIVRLFKQCPDGTVLTAEITAEADFGNQRGLTYNTMASVADLPLSGFLRDCLDYLTIEARCCTVTTSGAVPLGNDGRPLIVSLERLDRIALSTMSGAPAAVTYQSMTTKVKIRLAQK